MYNLIISLVINIEAYLLITPTTCYLYIMTIIYLKYTNLLHFNLPDVLINFNSITKSLF